MPARIAAGPMNRDGTHATPERTPERTPGTLLDGRVRYDQFAQGFRTGIEPVLLAASVPARGGERVLEAGCGAGAGLLCLAERVPGLTGVGVDRAVPLVGLARDNARMNQRDDLLFLAGDVTALPVVGRFDHAFANPPYHVLPGTASSSADRNRAKRADPDVFARWAAGLAGVLRHRGTLTFILPASHLPAGMAGMVAAGCAIAALFPLWRGPGKDAGLVILRAVRGGRMPLSLSAGLMLHQADGRYTRAATAVLSSGMALEPAMEPPRD